MPRKSRAKNIPSDIVPAKRPTSPKSKKIAETVGSPFAKSKLVNKAPAETKEFRARAKIAKLMERQPNITGKVSVTSVTLENKGIPDELGKVRAKVNIGRGITYVIIDADKIGL